MPDRFRRNGAARGGNAAFHIMRSALTLAVTALLVGCPDATGPDDQDGTSNHAPVLASISPMTATAGQTVNVTITATDADGDPLTFSIPTNPGFLSITDVSQSGNTTTASLVAAPASNVLGSFDATIRVSDPSGATDDGGCHVDVVTTPETKLFLRSDDELSTEQTPQGITSIFLYGSGTSVKWSAILEQDLAGDSYGFTLWLGAGTSSGQSGYFDVSLKVRHAGAETELASTRITVPYDASFVRYSATVSGTSGGVAGDKIILKLTLGGVSRGGVMFGAGEADSHVLVPGVTTVTSVTVDKVTVSPAAETIYEGETIQLHAVVQDATGDTLSGHSADWSTSNAAVASVSSSGVVEGLSPGVATITATVDGKSGTASITVTPAPVASVTVDVPGFSTIYTGTSKQLVATTRDANGLVLAGREITWSSSDIARATVDENGLVTAVGAGAVTITATSEGQSGTAEITVAQAPVADWSGAAEWVTYQGNASHNGYVEATVDPRVFSELWVTTVASGTPLSSVTAGDGHVFVSTSSYSGPKVLWVLDASSGASSWSYDFGDINSVDPPAAADGKVYLTTGGHQDSYLWAFDVSTGDIVFSSGYSNQWSSYYAPTVVDGAVYMAGGYYGGMYSFDATNGDENWFVSLNQYDEWTPAVRDGLVYAYTGEYDPKVTVVDAATGTVSYEIADPNFDWDGWSMHLAPTLGESDNLLAIHDGRLISFNLQSRVVGWERAGTYEGNVTVAGGVLYVINDDQVEARAEADGTLQWMWVPPEGTPARTLIVTDNLLFVSTWSNTYAIDLGARSTVWSYAAAGYLALSNQGILFISGSDGRLVAIDVR